MNDIANRVLGFLDYKNKVKVAEWEERLWQQHLRGAPEDFRADEDRQRYLGLLARATKTRDLAQKLHTRRAVQAPRFEPCSTAGA